jgi:hypothetical protein
MKGCMSMVWVSLLCVLGPMTAVGQPAAEHGVVPPCPTVQQQSAASGVKAADGTAAPAARPAESSIILPSVGSPPAAQSGDPKRAGIDCQLAPDHPNAIRPGDAARSMPEQSK